MAPSGYSRRLSIYLRRREMQKELTDAGMKTAAKVSFWCHLVALT